MSGGIGHPRHALERVWYRPIAHSAGACVSQREHPVVAGLAVETSLQFGESLGVLLGQIDRLREVVRDVVQLPSLLRAVELVRLHPDPRHPAVETRGDPSLVVQSAVAEDLEVLRGALARPVAVERVAHRDAVERHLLDAVHLVGRCDAGHLVNRRRDVGHVVELASQSALVADPLGPRDREGVTRAAEV